MQAMTGDSFYSKQYYYRQLKSEQKTIYRDIYNGLAQHSTEIRVPIKPIEELSHIYNAILQDNPLFFYVSPSFLCTNRQSLGFNFWPSFLRLFSSTDGFYLLKPEYTCPRRVIAQYSKTIRQYLQHFEFLAPRSDLEKEKYVHDHIVKNFSYDYSYNSQSYTVLGPILNNQSVCSGISKFTKLLLDYLNVPSLIVHGKSKHPSDSPPPSSSEDHAWNIVSIDGKTYHLDVTWDMTLKNNVTRYDYFNLSDEEIRKDHSFASVVPVCNSKGNDFFTRNSLIAHDPNELATIIARFLLRGQKSIVVKLMNVVSHEKIADKVMSIAMRQYERWYRGSSRIGVSYNPSQMVFEITFS